MAAAVSVGRTSFLPKRRELEDRVQMIRWSSDQRVLKWNTEVEMVGLI